MAAKEVRGTFSAAIVGATAVCALFGLPRARAEPDASKQDRLAGGHRANYRHSTNLWDHVATSALASTVQPAR